MNPCLVICFWQLLLTAYFLCLLVVRSDGEESDQEERSDQSGDSESSSDDSSSSDSETDTGEDERQLKAMSLVGTAADSEITIEKGGALVS